MPAYFEAMAVTEDQAAEFLEAYGIEVPDIVLTAVVAMANSRNACLELHYTPEIITLIQSYLLALFAVAQGGRMVTSQRAVNGASRSFQYKSTSELWRGLGGLLATLDTEKCVAGIVPPNPEQTTFAGMWIGKGCCMGGRR